MKRKNQRVIVKLSMTWNFPGDNDWGLYDPHKPILLEECLRITEHSPIGDGDMWYWDVELPRTARLSGISRHARGCPALTVWISKSQSRQKVTTMNDLDAVDRLLDVGPPPMTMGRAEELNDMLTTLALLRDGLLEDREPPSLQGIALADLLVATKLVQRQGGVRGDDGMTSMPVTSDPRLVAALYTAAHYAGSDLHDGSATVVAAADGNVVLVVKEPEQ